MNPDTLAGLGLVALAVTFVPACIRDGRRSNHYQSTTTDRTHLAARPFRRDR